VHSLYIFTRVHHSLSLPLNTRLLRYRSFSHRPEICVLFVHIKYVVDEVALEEVCCHFLPIHSTIPVKILILPLNLVLNIFNNTYKMHELIFSMSLHHLHSCAWKEIVRFDTILHVSDIWWKYEFLLCRNEVHSFKIH
jgi:hypothetical protein